jgi:hypothetical protein
LNKPLSFSIVPDFDYVKEVRVVSWERILSFHVSRQNKRLKQTQLQSVKDEKAAQKCQTGGTGDKLESNLAGHVSTPIADANSNDNDDGNKTGEPFMKSDSIPVVLSATIMYPSCSCNKC